MGLVERVELLEEKLQVHGSHWNAVAHVLDFAAVIVVAWAIIGVTHKLHGRQNIKEEIEAIELNMHREKNATIVAVCIVVLALVIKMILHFK